MFCRLVARLAVVASLSAAAAGDAGQGSWHGFPRSVHGTSVGAPCRTRGAPPQRWHDQC
jgi:hypothetical protein